MKNKQTQKRKGFTLVELLVVIAIIVALAGLATPAILNAQKKQAMAEAVSNSKQIYSFLLSFDTDFGSFPDDQKAQDNPDFNGFSGNRSNKLLGQLIASGSLKEEKIFYAKGGNPAGNKKPDNKIEPRTEILKAGECGFAYVLVSGGSAGGGANKRGLSTSDNGGIPVLMAPVSDAQATFKIEPYDGKGVYLTVGGSAETYRINQTDKKMRLPSGKTLLETGIGSVWGSGSDGLNPTVLLPE